MKRREFLKIAGITAAGSTLMAGYPIQKPTEKFDPLNEKGLHPILEKDLPHIFIDSCMQIWPDAQFHVAHRHGVTSYGVTAWDQKNGIIGLSPWGPMTLNFMDKLKQRGYRNMDVGNILGGNYMRVFEKVWASS